MLSGKHHEFYTGVYMVNVSTGQTVSRVVKTDLFMRVLSDSEISRYLEQDPHFNTYAQGYDPLGNISASFVRRLEGSYNNFIRGIPLEVVVEMLPSVGYKL